MSVIADRAVEILRMNGGTASVRVNGETLTHARREEFRTWVTVGAAMALIDSCGWTCAVIVRGGARHATD